MRLLPFILAMITWMTGNSNCSAQTPASEATNLALFGSSDINIHPFQCELQRLQKARLHSAVTEGRLRYQAFVEGRGTLDLLIGCGQRIATSRLELAKGLWEQLAIRKQLLQFMRAVEETCQARFQAGQIKQQDYERTVYFRLDAELQVLRYPGYSLIERNVPVPPAMMESRIILPPPESEDKRQPPIVLSDFVQPQRFVIDMDEQPSSRLPKQMANSAMTELALRTQEYAEGRGLQESIDDAAMRARHCRLKLADSRAQRVAILTEFRDFQRESLESNKRRLWAPTSVKPHFFAQLNYELRTAEIDLARCTASLDELRQMSAPFPLPNVPPRRERLPEDPVWPTFVNSNTYKIDETEPTLRWMPQERMNDAMIVIRSRYDEFRVGRGTMDIMLDWAKLARDARLELLSDPAHRVQVLVEYRDFLKVVEDLNQARYDAGAIRLQDLEMSRYERLTAEIELVKVTKVPVRTCRP